MRREPGTEAVVCCFSPVSMVAGVLIGCGGPDWVWGQGKEFPGSGRIHAKRTSDQETSCAHGKVLGQPLLSSKCTHAPPQLEAKKATMVSQ